MKKMPNKDPTFWQNIYLAITASATWQGAGMAMIIAILRVLYDNQNTKPIRIILEALICGSLSLCITSLIEIFHLPSSAAITIGGAIGFIGVSSLREIVIKFLNKKADHKERPSYEDEDNYL